MTNSFIIDATGSSNQGARVDGSGALHVFVVAGSVNAVNAGGGGTGSLVELKNVMVAGSELWTHPAPSNFTTGSIGAITSGTNATIITKLFAGSTLVYGWSATSTGDSQITLVNNATRMETRRLNVFSERTIGNTFISPIIITAGSILVQAVHAEGVSQGFEASIFYHEI